jgi:hypothetical protein
MADWERVFLEALRKTPNVSAACASAGVARKTAYAHRNADPEFAAAWDDALEQSTDSLVGECYRRACQGTERPVFHQGEECGRIKEYSDTLAIFLLKAHRRSIYGDKAQVDVTTGGQPLTALAEALARTYGDPQRDGSSGV